MLRPVWVLPMGHAFRKVSKCQLVCQDHGSKATPAEPGGLGSSQLAGDRCRNLTRLLFPALSLPSLTPSQSHHQGLSCNLLSWWMRQGAPRENTRILSPGAASSQKSPQRFLPFFFLSFGYSTMHSQNLDQIIAHYPAQLVPNPLHHCNQ